MSRPRLTIFSLSPIHQDGRVLRQIAYAAPHYDVTVVGWGHLDKDRPHVVMRPIQRVVLSQPVRVLQGARMLAGRLTPRAFERWYWAKPDHQEALQAIIDSRPQLIHANEAIGLPIAMAAAQRTGAKVLFDAHEYATEHRADSFPWRLFAQPFYDYVIRTYAPQADAMITVAEPIARRYQEVYGLRVEVIHNAPSYRSFPFRKTNPQHIRLIHHGAALPERHLELMIHMMTATDERFTLDFMLVPVAVAPGYQEKLAELAQRIAPHRVRFRPPVPPAAITETLQAYDIGVFLMEPTTLNHAMAMPNKLFEYIMAGLGVVISPTPAMKALVAQYGVGVVADDFTPVAMSAALNGLSAEAIDTMKRRSLEAAKTLNAEREMAHLHAIYQRLLGAASP